MVMTEVDQDLWEEARVGLIRQRFLTQDSFPDDFEVSDFNNDGILDFAVNKSFVREVGIWFGN